MEVKTLKRNAWLLVVVYSQCSESDVHFISKKGVCYQNNSIKVSFILMISFLWFTFVEFLQTQNLYSTCAIE